MPFRIDIHIASLGDYVGVVQLSLIPNVRLLCTYVHSFVQNTGNSKPLRYNTRWIFRFINQKLE